MNDLAVLLEKVFIPSGAAAISVAVLSIVMMTIVTALRRRGYQGYHSAPTPTENQRPYDPERLQRSIWSLVDKIHQEAIEAQVSYNRRVVVAASCAAMAVLALALSFDGIKGYHESEAALCWSELFAVVLITWCFAHGRKVRARWLILRTRTELLRQYSFVAGLFPADNAAASDLTGRYELQKAEVERRIFGKTADDLIHQVEQYWQVKKAILVASIDDATEICKAQSEAYLSFRARRQLQWFDDSVVRLHSSTKARELCLAILFYATMLLVVLKLAIVTVAEIMPQNVWGHFAEHMPRGISVALLLISGATAAATAYYFNQNARSLIHRYTIQRRSIQRWLDANGTYEAVGVPAQHCIAKSAVIEFEDLMIEELVDWLRVSSHDALELSA